MKFWQSCCKKNQTVQFLPHMVDDDRPLDKRKNYWNCSVLYCHYCTLQLHTVIFTLQMSTSYRWTAVCWAIFMLFLVFLLWVCLSLPVHSIEWKYFLQNDILLVRFDISIVLRVLSLPPHLCQVIASSSAGYSGRRQSWAGLVSGCDLHCGYSSAAEHMSP